PRGALVGQTPRRGAAACAGTGAAQGMGVRGLRHQSRLGAHRSLLGRRWPGGVGLCGGHRRTLGALVLLLAPPPGHSGERLTAEQKYMRELEVIMNRLVPAESASAFIDEKIRELGDWRGKTLAKV